MDLNGRKGTRPGVPLTGAARLTRRWYLASVGSSSLGGLAAGFLGACGGVPERGGGAGGVPHVVSPATLDVWVWWKDPVESLQQMGESFAKKHPGSAVNVDSPGQYWDKLTAALAGNAGPDVFFMNNVNYWAWAGRGLLLDLDTLVASDAE